MVEFDERSCSREVISEMGGESILAATRGRRDLANAECAETTWVKGESFKRLSSRGETVSGIGCLYVGEAEWMSELRPSILESIRFGELVGDIHKTSRAFSPSPEQNLLVPNLHR